MSFGPEEYNFKPKQNNREKTQRQNRPTEGNEYYGFNMITYFNICAIKLQNLV